MSQLVQGKLQPLPESNSVLCLEESDELADACTIAGIARISGEALGEPLFELSWLVAPRLELLPDSASRSDCNTQWEDLRVDLLSTGTPLADDGLDAPFSGRGERAGRGSNAR